PVGGLAVENVHLAPAQRPAVARALGTGLDLMKRVATRRLLMRAPPEPLAGDHGREMRLLLRLAAAEQQRGRPEEQRADDRLGNQPTAQLLEHDHQVDPAEPGAAVRLGYDDAEPSEPSHLRPQLAREALAVRLVAQRPDALERRLPLHELAGRPLQDLLLLDQGERHGQSGSPSTFLAMMLSWISDVPPSMVLPRERSQSRVSCSSSSLNPVPSQPSPWGPAMDIISSRRR